MLTFLDEDRRPIREIPSPSVARTLQPCVYHASSKTGPISDDMPRSSLKVPSDDTDFKKSILLMGKPKRICNSSRSPRFRTAKGVQRSVSTCSRISVRHGSSKQAAGSNTQRVIPKGNPTVDGENFGFFGFGNEEEEMALKA